MERERKRERDERGVDECMDEERERWINGWMNGERDELMDGWRERVAWMEGWRERELAIFIHCVLTYSCTF